MAEKACKTCKWLRKDDRWFPSVCGLVGLPTSDDFKCDRHEPIIVSSNADRIRGMSDEELADFGRKQGCHQDASNEICRKWMGDCCRCWLEWLKSPAEMDGDKSG